MKTAQRILSLLLVFVLMFGLVLTVTVEGYENYDTLAVSDEEREKFLDDFERIETEEYSGPITGYAISEQGLIALHFGLHEVDVIHVYGADGRFLYGYQFRADAVDIFFEDENVSIHWHKSDYIGSFDTEGNCLLFRKALNTKRNQEADDQFMNQPASGQVGDIQYQAKLAFGPYPTYTQFSILDRDGNWNVICDITERYYSDMVAAGAVLLSCIAFGIFIIIRNKKESQCEEADAESEEEAD